jgi:hypothetical protein
MKEKLSMNPQQETNPTSYYFSIFRGDIVPKRCILKESPLLERALNTLLQEGIIVGQWGFDSNGQIDLYVFMSNKGSQEKNKQGI